VSDLDARLDALRAALGAPPPPTHADPAALAPWRDRIDTIDRVLVALLNERARSAASIGEIKKALGVPVYAPRREEEVLENALGANGGPLSAEAVRRLVERVIDETRSLERALSEGDAST
jgi:chorismate mutase